MPLAAGQYVASAGPASATAQFPRRALASSSVIATSGYATSSTGPVRPFSWRAIAWRRSPTRHLIGRRDARPRPAQRLGCPSPSCGEVRLCSPAPGPLGTDSNRRSEFLEPSSRRSPVPARRRFGPIHQKLNQPDGLHGARDESRWRIGAFRRVLSGPAERIRISELVVRRNDARQGTEPVTAGGGSTYRGPPATLGDTARPASASDYPLAPRFRTRSFAPNHPGPW